MNLRKGRVVRGPSAAGNSQGDAGTEPFSEGDGGGSQDSLGSAMGLGSLENATDFVDSLGDLVEVGTEEAGERSQELGHASSCAAVEQNFVRTRDVAPARAVEA